MRQLQFLIPSVPASPVAVADFERDIGLALPSDFREFLLTYNGGYTAMKNRFYVVPERFAEYRNEYGVPELGEPGFDIVETFGLLPPSDVLSMRRRIDAPDIRESGVSKRWLPIASNGCGCVIFLRREKNEWKGLLFWDNQTGESYQIADSCFELYEGLIEQN